MTGTAQTEAEEFSKIYSLDVVTIPTNRPLVRKDHEDRVYRTEREKWESIIEEIKTTSDEGRPILVGTTSVEKSEMLSNMLKRKYGVEHAVLNAKFHEREADIVAGAGRQVKNAHGEMVGAVTIATNMAGRGTDIKLSPEAHKSGGLHVIGTERHTARRIDNQLRGRSGRQGDPGSSRFYVSLQDDLMKMFAGEWTIKVLGWIGMEEGMAIEDKRISKAILRAQKKVEERNYLARKNLLEYDEVMDYQRTTFYGMRQRVLTGMAVDEVIWSMIGQSITDAVDKYMTQDYVAATIAEWARVNFEVSLEPYDLRGMRDINDLEGYIKAQARAEVETNISATLGEFMGEDSGGTDSWDARGLQSWAMSRFHVSLTPQQIRQMEPREVEDRLREAAIEQINKRDVAGLVRFLDPNYAENELCAWAKDKFGVDVKPQEMLEDEHSHSRKPPELIVEMIDNRARASYARREIEYPVEHTLTFAFGAVDGSADNPYAAEYVHNWVLRKYGVDMPLDEIRTRTVKKLYEELVRLQAEYLKPEKLQQIADELVAAHPDKEDLRRALSERLDQKITPKDMDAMLLAEQGDNGQPVKLELNAAVARRLRAYLRRELTDLEQYVLVQIFDTSWKDHLYAMDMLKASIGLHSFAEQDPRVLFKKEGFEFFRQMMVAVRDKVTDLIFRARVVGAVQARSAYRETSAVHESTGGYGVRENVAATADAAGDASKAQAPEQSAPVKTIVRETARVGRNDPCPCGSGKKYKKCCGAGVA